MAGLVEVIILFAVLYWLFYPRAQRMVDVLSARLQKVYAKWESHSEAQSVRSYASNTKHLSYAGLRQYGHQEQQRKRALARQASRELKSGDLLQIKEEPWQLDVSKKTRPFAGLCCNECTSNSRNSAVSKLQQEQCLQNILLVDAQNCKNSYLSQTFCHLTTVYRLKKYDYPQLAPTVLRDERLRNAIEAAAQYDYGKAAEKEESAYAGLIHRHEARAAKILYDMHSTLSDFLLRLTSWVLYKLLPCFLTSVVAHPAQVDMLKKASKTGLPLIFLPMHRSHLDYILISFILLNNNIRSPLVAAGDNLRIPVFGWLLRGLGAFFIKRRMDPVQGRRDIVYRAVLHTYMMECLRAGHNLEFFIEGGRTRTGKACLPKGGLLSVIVDAYMDGTIEDALLVPVSVNYEKLVDGNFVREQLGQPKQMETFGKAIKSIWSILNSNYGMMRIDFNQPFSLRELVRSFHACNKGKFQTSVPDSGGGDTYQHIPNGETHPKKTLHSIPSSASLYGTDVVAEEHRQLVECIARHIVHDCSESTAVMSTNAVAFLLLSRFRNGVSTEKLVEAMEKLKKDLFYTGKDVGFTGEMIDVINHACDLLGPGLVRRERVIVQDEPVVMVRPFTMVPNVIELSYYSNVLLPHFVVDSVIATALYSLIQADESEPVMSGSYRVLNFSEQEIQHYAHDLCEILQFEFIFTKPCRQLEAVIEEAITQLKYKEILLANEPVYSEDQQWSMRFAKNFDEDSDSGEEQTTGPQIRQTLMLDTREEAVHTLEFYHSLLRPLIDVYVVSALGLQRLVGRQLTERDYTQELLMEMRTQLKLGFAQHEESLSVDPFKNSLKLFERWDILECLSHDRIKLYYLKDEYDSEESVQNVFSKVKKFKCSSIAS